MPGGWGEVPGGWDRDRPWRGRRRHGQDHWGEKSKRKEGGLWLGPRLVASGFSFLQRGFSEFKGHSTLMGGEGSIGSVPVALHAPSGSLKHPWGPGRWQHPCLQVRNPGPARLSDLAQGRQFTVCVCVSSLFITRW